MPAVFLLLALVGCSREPPITPGDVPTYALHVEPLMVKRCLSCHSAEDPQGRLVLDPGRGYAQLAGRDSIQVGTPLVTPGDPDASYLWRKLIQAEDIHGKGMPKTVLGARKLPRHELELIRAWIEQGAAE